MNKSKLINLFKTFSDEEMKSFGDFIISPYHNKNKNVIKLYEVIRNYHPELTSHALKKEKVFTKIFPKTEFNEKAINLLSFYLYKAAKKFLIIERVLNADKYVGKKEREYVNPEFYLFREFLDRNLLKEAKATIEDIDENITKEGLKGKTYYMNRFLHALNSLDLEYQLVEGKYEKYITKHSFEDLLRNLTNYYFLTSLKYYSIILNTRKLLKADFNIEFFEKIIGAIDFNDFRESPIIMMHYNIVMMFLKPDEDNYFYKLRDLTNSNLDNIEIKDAREMYVNLENYCIRKLREGKQDFNKELFKLYKSEIDNQIFNYGQTEKISHHFFRSVVSVAINENELEWAEFFIEKYKDDVMNEFREPVYYYSLSRLEFAKRNFDKSLQQLGKVNTSEVFLKVETKLLQSLVYYELEYSDSLDSLLDAMKHFLHNVSLLPDDRKIFYNNFIKFLSRLHNLKHKKDEFKLDQLRKQIEEAGNVYSKKWLLEKASELYKISPLPDQINEVLPEI